MKIEKNTFVEMHYRIYDDGGTLVESTEGDEPVRYLHGAEEILPGLENGLDGVEAGATVTLELEAEDAYGEYNPDGLVSVPRKELPAEHDYAKGDWISISVEDDEEDPHEHDEDCDHEMEMQVVEIRDDEVILDANHPLAGKRVRFEVDVLSVSSAG